MIYFLTIILASFSILYELAYTNLLINLFGNSMLIFSTIIGVYLFFLGVGTYIEKKLKNVSLGVIEIVISLIAFLGLFYLTKTYFLYNILLAILPAIFIAILSGIELPLLIKLARNNTNKIIAFDYFGAVVGTIVFNLVLYRYMSPTMSIILISLLNFITGTAILLYEKRPFWHNKKYIILTYLFLLLSPLPVIIYNIYSINDYIRTQFLTTKIQLRFPIDKNISIKFIESYKTSYQQVDRVSVSYSPLIKEEYQLAIKDKGIELNRTTLIRECLFLNYQEQNCKDYQQEYAYFLYKKPLEYIHKKKLNILILGGGDVYDLTAIPMDRINEVILIDIDDIFIQKELKRYSKQIKPYLDKLHIINMDASLAIKLLSQDNYKFDYIIYDLPPYVDRIKNLSSKQFFYFVNKLLNKDGLFVSYKFANENRIKNIMQYFNLFKTQIGHSFNNGLLDYSDVFLYFKRKKDVNGEEVEIGR